LGFGGFFGSIWGGLRRLMDYIAERFTRNRTSKSIQRQKDKVSYARLKDMEVRARRAIPLNPSQMVPQKRGG